MTRRSLVHALPVFGHNEEGPPEPGWLILTRKRSSPLSRHFPKLGKEVAVWEPSVKSWFVIHEAAHDAVEAVHKASSQHPVDFCGDCSQGVPCGVWNGAGLKDSAFEPREPDETEPSPEPIPEDTFVAPIEMLNDFMGRFVDEFGDKARAMFEAFVERARMERPAPMPRKADPVAAAQVLGLGWPCTPEALTTAFRAAVARHHPDHGGSAQAMARVNAARKVLQDALAGAKA